MPQPYKPWDFCRSIGCLKMIRSEKERREWVCKDCKAFQMHDYLSERGQIYEAH